jgi:hypothetical protein
VLRALITGSAATALGGGALASLTFFFLQPKGAALVLVGLAALVWLVDHEHRNEQRRFALPLSFALGAALVGAGGIAIWGLDPFTTLLTVADGNVAMNHLNLSYAPLALAVGLAALIGVACYRDRLFDRVTVLLLLLQAGLCGSVLHLPDLWHLTINAFPLLMLTARLAAAGSRERPRPRGWRLAMGGLLALVVGIGIVRAVSRNVRDARLAREWIDVLGGIIDGEEFFAFTFLPSFYLELETLNPYYNSVLYTASHPEAHFERNVDILTRRQPRFVLADYSSVEKYGHTLDNPVDRFIRGRYRRVHELAHTTGVIEVWELRPDGRSSPAETNRPNRRENP